MNEINDNSRHVNQIQINRIRNLVKRYIDQYHYESAVFWADKVFTLSNEAKEDVYLFAQTLYLTSQYHRASHLIRIRELDKSDISCRYLAARCHYECKEWQEALDILDQVDGVDAGLSHDSSNFMEPLKDEDQDMEMSVKLLRGQIYATMEKRLLASNCYREALYQDLYCFEAFDLLVNNHLLTSQEENELLQSLPFSSQCDKDDSELVKFLYSNCMKKYQKPGTLVVPKCLEHMANNFDTLVQTAERHYYNCDFKQCYKITSRVMKRDLFNHTCLSLHIAVLVELGKTNELFPLAHRLVDLYPNKPVAWFAVGCYYYVIGEYEPARRYFSKATTLERVYGPAWLAFGHSFAAANEHDQAMAAYFTASQLMKGCHLPLLYIGLEYGLTNNAHLAEQFFCQSLAIAPDDPFVLHEMGVTAFQNNDWTTAEKYFGEALSRIGLMGQNILPEKWEPLFNNLGHVCRKRRKYEESLDYHCQALSLSARNPSTYSALGYTHVLMGNNLQAVDYFHKALSLKSDDTFSTTMLGHIMETIMADTSTLDLGVIPEQPMKTRLNISSISHHDNPPDNPPDTPSLDVTDTSMSIVEVEMVDND